MTKNTTTEHLPFFKFYILKWTNGDISLESLKLQGLFINICAFYWSKECDLSLETLQKKFKSHKKSIEMLKKRNIIKIEGECVTIKFLDDQFQKMEEISAKNTENGRIGGKKKKRTVSEPEATAKQPLSENEAIRQDKIRQEYVLHALCSVFGKQYKQPEDRMNTESQFYSDVDNAYDKLVEGMTPDEIKLQVECYMKHCAQVNRMLVGNPFKLIETLSGNNWVVLSGHAREKPPDPYQNARDNLLLWTKVSWEKFYDEKLNTDNDFRKAFGYAELRKSSTVGSNA